MASFNQLKLINDKDYNQQTSFDENDIYLITNTKRCLWKNVYPGRSFSSQTIYFNTQANVYSTLASYKYIIVLGSISNSINDGIFIKKFLNPLYESTDYSTAYKVLMLYEVSEDTTKSVRFISLLTVASCGVSSGYNISITGTKTTDDTRMIPWEIWGTNE